MARGKDRTVYTEVVASEETGEVKRSKTIIRERDEPEFIKIYIDCLFTLKGLRKGLNPIFLAFLQYMSYANVDEDKGGQLIYTNKALKMQIAKKLGLGIDSVNKALSEFVKSGLFKRVDVGTYQVNPNYVGRGKWSDIKSIIATFDFNNKEVVADIVKEEEDSMTEHQEQLERNTKEQLEQMNMDGEFVPVEEYTA